MKKEIGSIYSLTGSIISQVRTEDISFPRERMHYSLCREAFLDIARSTVGGAELF